MRAPLLVAICLVLATPAGEAEVCADTSSMPPRVESSSGCGAGALVEIDVTSDPSPNGGGPSTCASAEVNGRPAVSEVCVRFLVSIPGLAHEVVDLLDGDPRLLP